MQAEGFLDHGVKVGQFLGLGPRHGLVFALLNSPVYYSVVQLTHQLGVYLRVLDKEVENSRQRDGSCLRTCKHHRCTRRQDTIVIHEWVVVRRLSKLREQINTTRVGPLIIRETKLLNLGYLLGALIGTRQCEKGYRVYTFIETDALSKEADRVFPQETIEDGHLADLVEVSIGIWDTITNSLTGAT